MHIAHVSFNSIIYYKNYRYQDTWSWLNFINYFKILYLREGHLEIRSLCNAFKIAFMFLMCLVMSDKHSSEVSKHLESINPFKLIKVWSDSIIGIFFLMCINRVALKHCCISFMQHWYKSMNINIEIYR